MQFIPRPRMIILAWVAGVLVIALIYVAIMLFVDISSRPAAQKDAGANGAQQVMRSDIAAGASLFAGTLEQPAVADDGSASQDPVFKEYGTTPPEAFQDHPELADSFKAIDPSFYPQELGTSGLDKVATADGQTLLILSGCSTDQCGDLAEVAAIQPYTGAVYLLKPQSIGSASAAPDSFALFGNPDRETKWAMYRAFESSQANP